MRTLSVEVISARYCRTDWTTLLITAILLNAVLQVLDIVTTLAAQSAGGTEVNPVSAGLMEHGMGVWVAVKLGLALVFLAFLPALKDLRWTQKRTAARASLAFAMLMVFVVVTNTLGTLTA